MNTPHPIDLPVRAAPYGAVTGPVIRRSEARHARVARICRTFNRQFPPDCAVSEFYHPVHKLCFVVAPGAVPTEDPNDTWIPVANCVIHAGDGDEELPIRYALIHLDEILACLARDLGGKPPTDHPLSQPALRGYAPYYLGGSAPHQLRLGHLVITWAGGVLYVATPGQPSTDLDGWQVTGAAFSPPQTIRQGRSPQGKPEGHNDGIVLAPPQSILPQESTP